ncbi:MAG TPA: SLC13 family permease, partial [Rhodobacteraceae bacterium]|nr:SLC13 family permease [Paracoccaceae bacterium]
MGISRQGQRISKQVRKTVVQTGDILLLLVPQERGDEISKWLGCLPLADRGLAVTDDKKVWLAIGMFAAAV